MSATTKSNLIINQGATFRQRFIWKDTKGRVVNLAGFTARMQIRETVTSTPVLVTLTTENGGMYLSAATGAVNLYMSDAATSALTFAKGVYDIEMIAPSTDVYRLVGGTITVSPEVTR